MEIKICQNCKKEFSVDDRLNIFLKKIEIPSPIFCYACRINKKQKIVTLIYPSGTSATVPTVEELENLTYQDNTIIFNVDGVLRKIFKITPHSDGGFDVHIPYHKEKSSYLYTIKIPYKIGNFSIDLKKSVIKEFTSDIDIKLSIHKSGFVQFSKGIKIISGIDQDTGKPKGLGIKIGSLDNPIRTGPTFGVTIWGLDRFDTLITKKKGKNYIEFRESDFIY